MHPKASSAIWAPNVLTTDGCTPIHFLFLLLFSTFLTKQRKLHDISLCKLMTNQCHILQKLENSHISDNVNITCPIVSIALSQLCNLRVGAHLRLQGPEPAVR